MFHLSFQMHARKWFADNGYDSNMGARPMFRLIEKEIQQSRLLMSLLFGKLSEWRNCQSWQLKKIKSTLEYLLNENPHKQR